MKGNNQTMRVLCVLFLFTGMSISCVPYPVYNPSPTPVQGFYVDNSKPEVCDWFLQTQVLRAKRISGASEYLLWYEKYGVVGLNDLWYPEEALQHQATGQTPVDVTPGHMTTWIPWSPESLKWETEEPPTKEPSSDNDPNLALAELAIVLKNQISLQDQFLGEWQDLGPIENEYGKDFWSKELVSIQLRTDAFKKMLQGINNQDKDLYMTGVTLLEQSQEKGLEAEEVAKTIQQVFGDLCVGE